jgi:hypothetical protein
MFFNGMLVGCLCDAASHFANGMLVGSMKSNGQFHHHPAGTRTERLMTERLMPESLMTECLK